VRTANRLLATVAVSAPPGVAILAAARDAALPGTGDALALARGAIVVAGPAALRGARLDGASLRLRNGRTLTARSVALVGYRPSARLVAAADDSLARGDQSALRRRLAIAALVSLVSIFLLATALARPLLRSVNRVASVAEQAMIDPLTGVANRRGFEHALTIELERSARRGHPLALVIADLDDFKAVNDRHGHDAGDAVLVRLADGLRAAVRSADTVARLGGEEFALLLPETTLDGALAVAERARVAFEASDVRLRGGGRLFVTASFGVADYPVSPDRASLLHDADQALYVAKGHGKNRVAATPRAVGVA
jgi:diguanylate cyclase (GGDEF)-like protein